MFVCFICIFFVGSNKKGVLFFDENGYWIMVIGGFNIVNSVG